MRRTLLALTCLTLVLTVSVHAGVRAAARPPVVTATTFLVSGRGWGHGVGMSQYGAFGLAGEGRSFDEILAHFYPGTALGPAPVARVRILIVEAKPALTVSSKAPFRVRDVFGKTYPLPAAPIQLRPALELVLNGAPTPLAGPIVFLPGRAPLELAGKTYRGQIEIAVAGTTLNAIDVVGLEDYLAGVVPREMPAAWPSEALKAQAVAARSYALSHRLGGKGFDLYADVRSQVYGGIAGEDDRTTAAIQATAGQVLLYGGKIVDALFHSTSGGRTVSAAEAFGTTVPYLVGVEDPYSSLSPVDRWGPTAVADATIRKSLGLTSPVLGLTLSRGSSGRVRSAVVTTSAGARSVTGSALRSGLGLRSTWITALSSLTLSRPGGAVVYGGLVTLHASAKGVRSAVLAQRVGPTWAQVATRPAGGEITYKSRLLEPASFRLSAGTIAGPVLRVPVAPAVTLSTTAAGALAGSVRPARPGTAIQIQVLDREDWLPAAQAALDDTGGFALELALEPGAYRARVAPAGGFAEGLSPTIRIE